MRSLAVWVEDLGPVEHDVAIFHVPVQFDKLLLEVKSPGLVLAVGSVVGCRAQLGVVAAVVFEHISQWLGSLRVDLVELRCETECGLEVALEGQQLLLALERDHCDLGRVLHVLQCLLVRQLRRVHHTRVEVIQGDTGHKLNVVRFTLGSIQAFLGSEEPRRHGHCGSGKHGGSVEHERPGGGLGKVAEHRQIFSII